MKIGRKLVRARPEDPLSHYCLAFELFDAGFGKEAVAVLDAFLAEHPRHVMNAVVATSSAG